MNYKTKKRVCENCGKPFLARKRSDTKTKWARCCSVGCWNELQKPGEDILKKALALYEQGHSAIDVAKKLNLVHSGTVRGWISKYGNPRTRSEAMALRHKTKPQRPISRKESKQWKRAICPTCDKSFWSKVRWRNGRIWQRFCSPACAAKGRAKGYFANGYSVDSYKGGKAIFKHIKVVEKVLGRRLKPGEVVHHINGNRKDNRNKNLLVCSRGYHQFLHHRMAGLYQKEHFRGL